MPTSSQALILHKETGGHSETLLRTQSLLINEPMSYAVASIYNLSGHVPLSKTNVDDGKAVKLLGKESAQLFKYHKMPNGYTNILSYDQDRETFKWEVLGGVDDRAIDDLGIEGQRKSIESSSTEIETRRPASAIDTSRHHHSKQAVDELMFAKLVGLGFRSSMFSVVDKDGHEIQDRAVSRQNVVRVPTIGIEKSEMSTKKPAKIDNTTDKQSERPVEKRVELQETPPSNDSQTGDSGFQLTEEHNRIKPSIYMIKREAKKRPTAAILSFRENECSFHAEVKFLIETQIGVRVKTIQYDPLHIRSGKPDLRSRWIVDFHSENDLEKAIRKGLVMGKDKIIIYKYDEIMKREFSSFKYFKAVWEAKKKLKGSKSTSNKQTTAQRKCGTKLKDAKPVEKRVELQETPHSNDSQTDDSSFQFTEEHNRIKPSIYMIKREAKKRPTAAILSLRENECSFHAEVKFLIETQIGVRVKTIQYDPLHIRSGKPDLRSRWIVDFHFESDLEKAIRKGLMMGKDKIIIYKYDEIMKREFSSFKYFKAVWEAKKKLKGSKSTGNKQATTQRKCDTKLKVAKSVH